MNAIDHDTNARPQGLSSAEAGRRLQQDGPNLLPQPDHRNWLRIVWSVLREPMLLLLVGAAGIYLLLGDPQEASVLVASVALVIALTVYQEHKSERALQALRDLSSPRACVLRDGETRWVAARELVAGDVILVGEGDRVPADARILDASEMMLDESMLTGESVPVRRSASPNGEQDENLIRASTLVVAGHGTAEVMATGSDTAVGQIGMALRTLRSPPTPMQLEIRRTVILFAALGLGSSLLMTLLYVAVHGGWLQGLLAGITLAMANIPEEFPVVLTVFLALGAWRMAKHKALVRRAPAIEALGSVTVLCTDKTGTLTENRMSVAELVIGEERTAPMETLSPAMRALLACADLASPDQPFDPMERAIHEAASKLSEPLSREGWQRIREYPLSGELLAVTHVWSRPGASGFQVMCKGAPEAIADLCGLEAAHRATVLAQVDEMARQGLRVLAAAAAVWDEDADRLPLTAHGFGFEWRGLLGFADPLRAGVREAVAEAQAAGVRVIMLTGDHLETARAIATQAGLANSGEVVLGSELALDGVALTRRIREINVFARVKPDHKLRLVDALKRDGQVVAMTGDGVNDAPALTAAHVGVAMGERGTDVAREAAAIVLLDDNFVTVVRAIQQGRVIYDNIVRAIRYVLAVHVPITGLAVLPLLFGGPLMLLPLHVVFLELIIDPASTLVFEREPAAADVMQRPPRSPSRRLLDAGTLFGSLSQGLAVFVAVAAIYALGRASGISAPQLAALSFTALVAGNLGLIVVNRAGAAHRRWWRQSNPAFWIVTLSALSLLLLVTRFEGPGHPFRFAPPPLDLSLVALLLPLLVLGLVEGWRGMRAPRTKAGDATAQVR
ncbi:cation-translocating P-type ATPase [Pseudoxanthomonas sacheonensis]|uniref:cation-translocating P-type ATPase n=1 Tax=Pseudoxanthomonas sacheonensis TaxID=443615 RepID=UPI0013D53307|nr:cation-translocating P-type ATPase [Pseudoxanthomonas sacheonensis]KAF1710722.1 ATPase [Pseudoxanthomonas sacheonensis]